MATAHRTPTMIALKAAREAIQVAREVANPHVEIPRPPEPHDPPDPSYEHLPEVYGGRCFEPSDPATLVIAWCFALGSIGVAILAFKYGK